MFSLLEHGPITPDDNIGWEIGTVGSVDQYHDYWGTDQREYDQYYEEWDDMGLNGRYS